MLARLFVIIGGLIVLALTAALVVPYFIDWTGYRADFEREAGAILGRKVTVKGEATARLLPFPSVTFSDVSVGGGPEGGPALTMDTFSMDAELSPFMRGELLIFDMRMVRPRGTLELAEDGTVNWAVRPSSPIEADRIALEKLTVTEGQIEIRHAASGRTHKLSEINAEISARALNGPWRVNGTIRLDGVVTALSLSTGTVDEKGGMRLRVRAEPAVYPASLEADGNIRFNKNAAVYAGQFKISPKSVPAVEKAEAAGAVKAVKAEASPGYRLNGKFKLDHKLLSVEEFQFETGPLDNPYSAEGTGLLDFGREPRFALTASGAQVRFDEAVGADQAGGLTFSERLSALEAALTDLPRPTIPGTIDVDLPAIVAGDTTIRDVSLSAEPATGGWIIKSLAATLPGRTTLEADGQLVTETALGFKGSLLLAIGQPSGFAAWASKDVDEAIRRLPAAGFQAKVDLTKERQTFKDLELALGDATFRGDADSYEPVEAKPSTILRLTGGALDVDGLAAFASLFVRDSGDSRFADRNFDLAVKAGPVSLAGLTAETVDAAFRLRAGALEIDRLSIGGLSGATISAAGKIRNFPENPIGNIDASIVAVDLAPLIAAAAERYRDNPVIQGLDRRAAAYPGLFEDARIDLLATAAASGDTTEIALSAQGIAGGTALSVSLSGNGSRAEPLDAEASLTFSARNDDATDLLALYGLPTLPLGMTGPGETELSAKGILSRGLDTTIRLSGSDFLASFSGSAAILDRDIRARGHASLEASDIEPWLMTIGGSLPGMGTGLPVVLDAETAYANGVLTVSGLSGTVDEGAVAGDVNAELKDGKPHLTGELSLDEVDLEPIAAMVFGAPSLENGGAAWSAVPFQPKVLAPFSAELAIDAATLAAGQVATAYDARLAFRLDAEGLHISDLSAKLFGGDATGLFELKNTDGTGLVSGQWRLAGADLGAMLGDTGLAGTADFSTTLSTSGKSVGGLVAALSGSGTAALKTLTITGVNPDALGQIIARANTIGRDIDAAKTARFAPEIAAKGAFTAAPAEAAFTVAGGVLRAPPLKLDNPAASIEAAVQVDLNKGMVAAAGEISYRAGDEALVGSEPVMRFTLEGSPTAAKLVFDSEPLAQFLTQRALEIEQARVEAMQAALLEKQRLRREVRYYAALKDERDRAAELLRRKQEEERLRAEEKARQEAAEREARARAEAAAAAEREAAARAAAAAAAEREAKARAEAAETEARRLADEARRAGEERRQAEKARRQEADRAARAEEMRLAAEAETRRAARERARKIEKRPPPPPARAPEALIEAKPPGLEPDSVDGFLRMLQGTQ